jgi:hypothetical protein
LCLSPTIQGYGREVHAILHTLMRAVYQAREGPPASIRAEHKAALAQLKALCECMGQSSHDKRQALSTELLNDWEAIFSVLEYPFLPLTNNEAEQMLRHWVILRCITQGTRTEQGSRALALPASVIETCRRRVAFLLRYLKKAIAPVFTTRSGLNSCSTGMLAISHLDAVGMEPPLRDHNFENASLNCSLHLFQLRSKLGYVLSLKAKNINHLSVRAYTSYAD